jgi:hypothetical protein
MATLMTAIRPYITCMARRIVTSFHIRVSMAYDKHSFTC